MEGTQPRAPLYCSKSETPEVTQQAPSANSAGGAERVAAAERSAVAPAEDLALLRRAAAGDGAAFHTLCDRHMDRLYRLAFSLVGNAADAEDLLQETFGGAFRGLSRFEARSSVSTWLTRILVTQTARLRRSRHGKWAASLDADEIASPSVAGSSGAVDARIDIQAALAMLSPVHRQVLVLREFEQMSYGEIAEVLGVPQGTIESRLHRARAELRAKLSAYLP
jgi:RNA polymerase sigma-70 factor (ECF subfamily)